MTETKKVMGRPRKGYRQLSIKLPPEVWDLTRDTAQAMEITKAELWEKALKTYISLTQGKGETMIKIDKHIMQSALSIYQYQLEHDIRFFTDILEDNESTTNLTEATNTRDKIEGYKRELAKVNDLYNAFNAGGGCMADYEFFAKRKR